MNCCKNNCIYTSVIIGVIVGIILGVLYGFGLVSTGIVFWAYLVFGVLGVLLAPIYASGSSCRENERCFCGLKGLVLTSVLGTVIAAALGLILVPIVPTVVTAIVLGLATLFAVMLIISAVCLTNCNCRD